MRRAKLLARLGIAWHGIEAAVAIGAGIVAGSIALVGFGVSGESFAPSGVGSRWPLPTSVVITPVRITTLRMRWFFTSARPMRWQLRLARQFLQESLLEAAVLAQTRRRRINKPPRSVIGNW